jgi:hypothetical protein
MMRTSQAIFRWLWLPEAVRAGDLAHALEIYRLRQ